MSQKDIDRYDIISRTLRREITEKEAGTILSLSDRQVRRLKHDVRIHGAAALIHGLRGKASNNMLPEEQRSAIAGIIASKYSDFGPTLAAEKLIERHGIDHDRKTIRAIMITHGLWRPKRRKKETHRTWRQRKDHYGTMIQFDGSYEYWFEDRGPSVCLLAAIDDATGAVVHAVFAEHEGVDPVFAFWKDYLREHGRPRSIYCDKFSTYRIPDRYAKDNPDLQTQFQRACNELDIEPIFANSPQAKGRVERLFRTLQDRLIKELRLAGISTVAEANLFLRDVYLPAHNERFSQEAARKGDLHRRMSIREQQSLDATFSRQCTRTVLYDFTFRYESQWYQLEEKQPVTVRAKDAIIVERRLNGSIYFRLRGKYLHAHLITKRPEKKKVPRFIAASTPRTPWKPSRNHPWRQHAQTKRN